MFSLNSANSVTKKTYYFKMIAVLEPTISCMRNRDSTMHFATETQLTEKTVPISCFSDFSDSLNSKVLLLLGKTTIFCLENKSDSQKENQFQNHHTLPSAHRISSKLDLIPLIWTFGHVFCLLVCFVKDFDISGLKVARIPSCVVYFAWDTRNCTLNRALR